MSRTLPNIIITGTPGTGKTTHCEVLAEKCPELKHLSVNQVVKERECHEGWDEEYQSWIVDEDKVRQPRLNLLCSGFQIRDQRTDVLVGTLDSYWTPLKRSAKPAGV